MQPPSPDATELSERAAEAAGLLRLLGNERRLVMMCQIAAEGEVSARHADRLAALVPGRMAHVLQGGLQAWRAAGLPVEEAPGLLAGWLTRRLGAA